MKKQLLILSIIFPLLIWGNIFRNRPTHDFSKIYVPGKTFLFRYTIKKGDQHYKITPKKRVLPGMHVRSRNDFEQYLFPDTVDTTFIDTLLLSVGNLKVRKGRKFKEGRVVISFYGERYRRVFGSVELSNSNQFTRIFPFEEAIYESGFMNALQANPAAMISTSPNADTVWEHSFKISNQYSNKNWVTWEDSLEVISKYQITGIDSVITPLGKLKTWKVHSVANSKIGKTSLKTNFSEDYGFVVLDYTLIDGTEFKLELMAVEEKSTHPKK